jgi:hypothetical protein
MNKTWQRGFKINYILRHILNKALTKKINMGIKKARVQIHPRSCKKVIQKKVLTKGAEI